MFNVPSLINILIYTPIKQMFLLDTKNNYYSRTHNTSHNQNYNFLDVICIELQKRFYSILIILIDFHEYLID